MNIGDRDETLIFRAGAVQAAPCYRNRPAYFDANETVKKACNLIAEAGSKHARLIVFPETFLPGYPYWSVDLASLREWTSIWRTYLTNSIEVPGPETQILCRAAKEADTYVAMGINERDKTYDGRMYNSILFIGPHEGILGLHRKLNPTLSELLYHTRGDGGDNLKVYKTDLGHIGGLICGEHIQLPLIYHMIVQGEQINCSLWPGSHSTGPVSAPPSLDTGIQIQTRALCMIGQIFAISASCYIPEDQRPKDFYSNASFNRRGGSSIINPMGEYIAGPIYDQETIIYAEIDLDNIPLCRSIQNIVGSYSRWDLFSLAVQQKPFLPTITLEDVTSQTGELVNRICRIEDNLRRIEQQLQHKESFRSIGDLIQKTEDIHRRKSKKQKSENMSSHPK